MEATSLRGANYSHLAAGAEIPRGRMTCIEVLVLIAAVLLGFQSLFGSCRRRCRSPVIKFIIWLAYTVPLQLAAYCTGLMQSSAGNSPVYTILAVSLLAVQGCTISITAYSLDDNKQWLRLLARLLLSYAYVCRLAVSAGYGYTFLLVLPILFSFGMFENLGRIHACRDARLPSAHYGIVAEYMRYEHKLFQGEDDVDLSSMKGYSYVVYAFDMDAGLLSHFVCLLLPAHLLQRRDPTTELDEFINNRGLVTIDRIWRCDGKLLDPRHSSRSVQMKDLCNSFALFTLLKRRVHGFGCAEAGLGKTRKLVLDGLLRDNIDGEGYERAFRVTETELAFLYDSCFTKYAVLNPQRVITFLSLMVVAALILWAMLLSKNDGVRKVHFLKQLDSADRAIVLVTVAALGAVELWQFVCYFMSDWIKVWLVCNYVARPRWQEEGGFHESVVRFFCGLNLSKQYWENKLGQYSPLKSFQSTTWLPSISSDGDFPRGAGRKASDPIELPAQVKREVARALKACGGELSSGLGSLERNGRSSELSWACEQQPSEAHIILIWHVATSYCDLSPAVVAVNDNRAKEYRDVATNLSNYCAYLVAFVPELLPGHYRDTMFLFDQVIGQAREVLTGQTSLASKYEKIRDLDLGSGADGSIFKKGARLGKQLEGLLEQDEQDGWKVMAEFWAELILYIAPSDNVTGHIEHLAAGGEFLTHIWALLSHAGILKVQRPEPTYDDSDAPVPHIYICRGFDGRLA